MTVTKKRLEKKIKATVLQSGKTEDTGMKVLYDFSTIKRGVF